ncbi:MAG: hypothetical protein ABEI53_01530, partial [Candidatus Magasanikbacteria bacterium]
MLNTKYDILKNMVIYLYGKDSYRRKNKLQNLISTYEDKHGKALDVSRFDLSEDGEEWKEVKDYLKQPSMFQESKVAVIKEAEEVTKKGWIKTLKKYLDSKNVFILISEDREKPLKKFKFLTEPPVKNQKFEKLKGKKLKNFLNKKIKERNLRLSKKAWKFLFLYLKQSDYSSWLAVNEIKKIDKAGFENPIGLKNLKDIICWRPQDKMFNETRKLFKDNSLISQVETLERLI